MASNVGFVMTTKSSNDSLIPLYPKTTKNQILGWNCGEIFGPFSFTLKASDWVNKQQAFPLTGVMRTDMVQCIKVLSGSSEEMIQQEQAYNLLNPLTGVETLQNQIRFSCVAVPENDFTVEITWRR